MDPEEEKLCLKWNDFQENVNSAFRTFREDREFADVTLASEDGQQVQAHRVILASNSPFFLNLLTKNKHLHPLIYMRGIHSEDLIALVDFLYLGEANVYQKNLDSFLAVADELQMKGLMGIKVERDSYSTETFHKPQPKKTQQKQKVEANHMFNTVQTIETEPCPDETEHTSEINFAADTEQLDETIKSMMEPGESIIGGSSGNKRKRRCKVCGKEDNYSNIKRHIEANHLAVDPVTGRGRCRRPSDICGIVKSTRTAVKLHKLKKSVGRL